MQLFRRVTILALVVLWGAIPPGCGSGRGHLGKNGIEGGGSPEGGQETGAREDRVEQAVLLYHEGDLDGAAGILGEVLAVDPMNPRALQYRQYLDRAVPCTVYPGDTLSEIAGYYYGDVNMWPVLARANGMSDPRRLGVHSRLRVPWFPGAEPGKDELGRLQRRAFRGRKTLKIVVIPAEEDDTLESLARQYYGSERYGSFLADYNLLEQHGGALAPGTPLRIPVLAKGEESRRRVAGKGPRKPSEAVCLETAVEAMQNVEYEKACQCLSEIPRESEVWEQGAALLRRCRTEGEAHYERLGDAALQASDPESACRHWERALALDPDNARVSKKLRETRDLIRTLEMLPEIR